MGGLSGGEGLKGMTNLDYRTLEAGIFYLIRLRGKGKGEGFKEYQEVCGEGGRLRRTG